MKLITVDFDGTLFKGDSFSLMFRAGSKDFGIREWAVISSGSILALFLGLMKGKDALRLQFFKSFARTFKGKSEAELATFFWHLVEGSANKINQPLVEKIREHQEAGNQVIILSGALKPFLDALNRKLDLQVTAIGTQLVIDDSGVCTGGTGPFVNGEEKVKALTEWLKEKNLNGVKTEIWAYADSKSDIPLLKFVDKPIIVNPKPKMRDVAKINRWPIFEES